MLRTGMQLFKAALQKEELSGQAGAANKVEPSSCRSLMLGGVKVPVLTVASPTMEPVNTRRTSI